LVEVIWVSDVKGCKSPPSK